MVRNIVVLGGSSHPELTQEICHFLGIPPAKATLGKFSGGETRVEIQESVRDKDVFVVQSGGGRINDHLMELLVIISACKTASARRVTAVLPLFPYSRQPDYPYHKQGAPLAKGKSAPGANGAYETRPDTPAATPGPQLHGLGLSKAISSLQLREAGAAAAAGAAAHAPDYFSRQPYHSTSAQITNPPAFEPQPGYKQWVAQAGTLVADLLTCAGADHIITMDLHDPQYQGFFNIPVDNMYGRHLLKTYIQFNIPDYKSAIIVSPDAGGAKRATAIADALGIQFALIHKERRSTKANAQRGGGSMMLVGNVKDRVTILIDDLVDTSSTITRAAKLLKREGATTVYALVTHGVLSGDAIERVNASVIDKLVVTNSVPQKEHLARCSKMEELKVGDIFAETIRRVHHGESISVLFNHV